MTGRHAARVDAPAARGSSRAKPQLFAGLRHSPEARPGTTALGIQSLQALERLYQVIGKPNEARKYRPNTGPGAGQRPDAFLEEGTRRVPSASRRWAATVTGTRPSRSTSPLPVWSPSPAPKTVISPAVAVSSPVVPPHVWQVPAQDEERESLRCPRDYVGSIVDLVLGPTVGGTRPRPMRRRRPHRRCRRRPGPR